MIEIKELIKDYGAFRALNGVTFSLKKGEILGFLGPNGAGKSTTMKVLTGYISPDGGVATVAGHDVMRESLAVRRLVGYLPENTPLYEEMGLIEFLEFISKIRRIPASKRKARIHEIVEMCGLGSMAGKSIGQLSRGYRQRVGLAQALIHDPPILIMDEPTSALDPSQTVEIRELIKRIGREKSILLSTHIMGEATATCDRLAIISRGRIVAEGTPQELVRQSDGRRMIYVEAKAPEGELRSALGKLRGVERVESSGAPREGFASLRLHFEKANGDPRDLVAELLRKHNWMIRELHEEAMTLEQFFIRVTTQS